MDSTTYESEDLIMMNGDDDSPSASHDDSPSASHDDSPSASDVYSEGVPSETDALKKGPWTSAEDEILKNYVKTYGEGNWNAIQRKTGLSRCGKSCRLRWANHLRPNLKKCTFTDEEERRIVELHAKMGNKWAKMAAELPGRTDNEIKNYWNTRIKRRQRAGLPIYPPDVRPQTKNESQCSENTLVNHTDLIQDNYYGIPKFKKNLALDPLILSQLPPYCDVSASGMPTQGYFQNYNYTCPKFCPPVIPQSETMFPGANDVLPNINGYADGGASEWYGQPINISSPYEAGLDNTINSSYGVFSEFNANFFGNNSSSSSMPMFEAEKLELPSFQYSETQVGSSSVLLSPLLSLESQCLSPLDGDPFIKTLHEMEWINPINISSQQSSLLRINEMEDSETITPLSHSTASMSGYNHASGSSPDEHQSVFNMPGSRDDIENRHSVSASYNMKEASSPDACLDTIRFLYGTEQTQDQLLWDEAVAALKGEKR